MSDNVERVEVAVPVRFEDDPANLANADVLAIATAVTLFVVGWVCGAGCLAVAWWLHELF